MDETDGPAHTLPLIADLDRATSILTGPGAPFETTIEDVRGEMMSVLRGRARSLRELLTASAGFDGRIAMVFDDGRSVTFAEFVRHVASAAEWLRLEHGIEHGDRVAICGANSYGWIVTFWALLSSGAVTVAMNGWWTENEMRHALDLTEPALLMFDSKRADRLGSHDMAPMAIFEDVLPEMLSFSPDASLPQTPLDEDDAAILIFTSGTTGRPKAAVLSHRSVIHYSTLQNFIGARAMVMAGVQPTAGATPPTRLAVFPLFHVSGLGATVNAVHTGSTTAWYTQRFEADSVIDFIINNNVNVIGGTGTHILRLLESDRCSEIPPAQVLSVGMGGSATTPEIIRRVTERFPHLDRTMSTGYGSTETGSLVSFAPSWMLAASPECIGPPLPTCEVTIRDDDGRVLPDCSEGNICVRSPLLMTEYFRNPAANAESFFPGRWFNTGDFGRMEGGVLYIATRKRDLIIRGGENIYPFEVENCIEEVPGVIECAVVGIDHPILGQEVKAFVVVASDSSVNDMDIHSHCATNLAGYKVPASIEILSEPLPRNPSGKVLKHVLAERGESGFVED